MPSDWNSIDNLRKAWEYAKIDMKNDFVFDIIEHLDIKHNIEKVLRALHAQLQQGQYHPAPILSLPVPKNDHSFRPGTSIPPIDLIVLYATMQQLAPPLDKTLSECAYAYRLNPRRDERRQPLFSERESPEDGLQDGDVQQQTNDEEQLEEIGFPYGWFQNWILFDQATQSASREFEYVAVTDITAFFENISLRILFDRMRELGPDYRDLLDRLRTLLDYWDWVASAEKTTGKGLPQGNDVSSFLLNIYLRDLDQAMLGVVDNDTNKYYRYMDDIRLYTSNESEARHALVELEHTLRTLGLNVQTAKTEIKPATATFDPDVTEWMPHLQRDADDRVERASTFITEIFDPSDRESVDKWQRVYLRSLTVLGEAMNDVAVPIALDMFLSDPSDKMLRKNFTYLRRFTPTYCFEDAIYDRLSQEEFTFDYHRTYLYRLAAHCRGENPALKELALEEAINGSADWFSRVGAFLLLSTCRLSPSELGRISQAIANEGNTQVLRAAYVTLCQHSSTELGTVLDTVSYFGAPHQDYLRRYFFQLYRRDEVGERVLSAVSRESLENPFFIRFLHQLDLIKANQSLRPRFRGVLEEKLESCDENWPRLRSRLQGIYDAFVEHP